MIIGLVGRNAAGKTTVGEYLQKKGFVFVSLSDELRAEAKAQKIEPSRENLISLGNQLREKHGAGVLSERLIARFEGDRNYAVDSIRNPAEAEVLQKRKDFVLWFLDAEQKKRFERLQARKRKGEPQSFDEFVRLEKLEEKNAKQTNQQVAKTISLADATIANNQSLDSLYKTVDARLAEVSQTFDRPGWDEYFMAVAKTVASRSNCVKRKVAAIVVKDKRIISTGYNGTPRGVKNCNEGGCPRCNSFAESGTKLEECVCCHGEENAIVQASYHGASLAGGTLYTTYCPCLMCAKMVINSGIKKVVYSTEYHLNDTAKKILKEADVELVKI